MLRLLRTDSRNANENNDGAVTFIGSVVQKLRGCRLVLAALFLDRKCNVQKNTIKVIALHSSPVFTIKLTSQRTCDKVSYLKAERLLGKAVEKSWCLFPHR
jgi:hypothetical protein